MAPGLQPCSGLRPRIQPLRGISSASRELVASWRKNSAESNKRSGLAVWVPRIKQSTAAPNYLRWVPAAPGHGNRLSTVTNAHSAIPAAQGLFDPANDKDACGVGFVAELSKEDSRKCVTDALGMLLRMAHRGACGCEVNTGAAVRANPQQPLCY